MIDESLLRSLGWSDELIRAAGQVADMISSHAITESVAGIALDLENSTTLVSQSADAGGPSAGAVDLILEDRA